MRIVGSVLAGLLGLVILTIVFGSWYTVDQTERAVLLRNGAFVSIEQPGLHFKTPWIESVYKIDMQTHKIEYEKVNSYSADQQPADLKVSVIYHVNPDKISDMYSRFGGNLKDAVAKLITPYTYQQVKVVFGQYTAQDVVTKRGKLNIDAATALTQSINYDPVLVVEGVQVEDVTWSQQYIGSVEQRMQAEIQVQQREQELRQAKISADIQVAKATGEANSIKAKADAEAYQARISGEAVAAALEAKGKALAANPKLVDYEAVQKWNGATPVTMIPGSAVPFVNVQR